MGPSFCCSTVVNINRHVSCLATKKNANILQLFFYILDYALLFFFSFLLDIVSIVAKTTKFEQEYHISNQLFHITKKEKEKKKQLFLV